MWNFKVCSMIQSSSASNCHSDLLMWSYYIQFSMLSLFNLLSPNQKSFLHTKQVWPSTLDAYYKFSIDYITSHYDSYQVRKHLLLLCLYALMTRSLLALLGIDLQSNLLLLWLSCFFWLFAHSFSFILCLTICLFNLQHVPSISVLTSNQTTRTYLQILSLIYLFVESRKRTYSRVRMFKWYLLRHFLFKLNDL